MLALTAQSLVFWERELFVFIVCQNPFLTKYAYNHYAAQENTDIFPQSTPGKRIQYITFNEFLELEFPWKDYGDKKVVALFDEID